MIADTQRERPVLQMALAAALASGTLPLLGTSHAIAPMAIVIPVGLVLAAVFAFLQAHRTTWGKELRLVDLWSVPHVLAGSMLWLLGIGLAWSLAIAIAWEVVEISSRVREYPTNRVTDVVLAVAGWHAAQAMGA